MELQEEETNAPQAVGPHVRLFISMPYIDYIMNTKNLRLVKIKIADKLIKYDSCSYFLNHIVSFNCKSMNGLIRNVIFVLSGGFVFSGGEMSFLVVKCLFWW